MLVEQKTRVSDLYNFLWSAPHRCNCRLLKLSWKFAHHYQKWCGQITNLSS